MKADDQGLLNGKPVDLFPENWHIAESRFGKPSEGQIDAEEQQIIRSLVTAAIDSGVLVRHPGRLIEHVFSEPVTESDGVQVVINGFIDLLTQEMVTDHKTAKNTKYLKTPKTLEKNPQMLIYANVLQRAREASGLPRLGKITLRHNAFVKDPVKPVVRKIEAEVTSEQVDLFWDLLAHVGAKMVALRKAINTWSDVPEPSSGNVACNSYGGCTYRTICAGKESEEGCKQRLDRVVAATYITPTLASKPIIDTPSFPKGNPMSGIVNFAAQLAARKALNAAGASTAPAIVNPAAPVAGAFTPPPAAVPPPLPVATQAPTPDANGLVPPPWAKATCPACGGSGFNSKGDPCRICDAQSPVKSHEFVIVPQADNTVFWQLKTDDTVSGMSKHLKNAVPAAVAQDRVAAPAPTPAPVPAPVVQQAPAPAPVVVQAPAPVAAPAPAPVVEQAPAPAPVLPHVPVVTSAIEEVSLESGKGRPKKGFTLLIGCAPTKGLGRNGTGRGVVYLEEVMRQAGEQLAKHFGADSYYALDAFKRRDAMAAAVPQFLEAFGTDMVVACGTGPDYMAFLDAVRQHAGMVICGVVNS